MAEETTTTETAFGTIETPEMISLGAKLKQHATFQPNAPAVSCGPVTLTYAELHRRTNRLARGLQALGVKFGDMVTIGLPNGVGFVEACYAIWKLGATPQPVSFRLPRGELQAIVELARTPVVIADFKHEIDRPLVTVADIAARSDDDSDLPDAIAPVSKAPTSGGSTGRPKLILSGTPGVTPKETPEIGGWRLTPNSIAVLPAPLYHNAGFGMMMAAIGQGCHLVVMPRFDPEATLAEIEAALEEHPAVQSVAVIGLPDDDFGNIVHAIVQVRTTVSLEDLKAHLADRLVSYKQPRSYEFVDEPLRDDAGKVRRSALREARMKTTEAGA